MTTVETSEFVAAVHRYRGARTVAAIQVAAGLSDSGVRNMDSAQRMPGVDQVQALAAALDAPVEVLTRALLHDRGYDIGAELRGAPADVAAIARGMSVEGQRLLLAVARAIRDTGPS